MSQEQESRAFKLRTPRIDYGEVKAFQLAKDVTVRTLDMSSSKAKDVKYKKGSWCIQDGDPNIISFERYYTDAEFQALYEKSE